MVLTKIVEAFINFGIWLFLKIVPKEPADRYERMKMIVKILWENCTIGFECPNCGKVVSVDSQDEYTECECGKKYSLISNIMSILDDGTVEQIW